MDLTFRELNLARSLCLTDSSSIFIGSIFLGASPLIVSVGIVSVGIGGFSASANDTFDKLMAKIINIKIIIVCLIVID
jgi:hypothetical protein